jgi:vacuolar-type H+-ATPase subunit B/Vma2
MHALRCTRFSSLGRFSAVSDAREQGPYESRTIFDSLEIGWSLLRIFPRELLRRITAKTLDTYYDKEGAHE